MTAIRSETCRTTPKSWATKMYVRPRPSCRSSSRLITCALIDTSSAETGSSAISLARVERGIWVLEHHLDVAANGPERAPGQPRDVPAIERDGPARQRRKVRPVTLYAQSAPAPNRAKA